MTRRSCRRRGRTPSRSPARAVRICATARRWSASSPGWTSAAPAGELDEIAAAAKLREFRAGNGGSRRLGTGRPLVRHDFGRRPERRDHPLSRQSGNGARSRDRLPLSRRFRRAVPRRHHRHHADRGDRHAERRNARPLHPRPERPHRDRHGALSPGNHRRPDRCARPPRPLAGRPRLRSRHRPRRRLVPVGA